MKENLFLNDFLDTWDQIYTDLPKSRRVKRKWIKDGFTHQISFYGVLTEKQTEDSEYRRIEILSNKPFNKESFGAFYHMFQEFKPFESYTIWVFDQIKGDVKLVGRFR